MQCHLLPKSQLSVSQLSGEYKTLDLSQPRIMGILNVTPDSFSDGGQYNQVDNALRRCDEMLQAGATIIDIGGESTRPQAQAVATDEELSRVIPVVEAIRQRFSGEIWLSIDTSEPKVFERSVEAGADIWNDVRALKRPLAMQTAAKLGKPVIMMHMRGEPTTMDNHANYDDVIGEITSELSSHIELAIGAGIERHNLLVDSGFGFAKKYEHHKALLSQLYKLHSLGLPIVFGISRKRFLKEVLEQTNLSVFKGHKAADRDAIGMAAALFAVQQGASIIRTHNVAMTMQGLALWQQVQ